MRKENDPKQDLDQLVAEAAKQKVDVEQYLDSKKHKPVDHYHDQHHFDRYGHHDDISKNEFTVKQLFHTNKKLATFQIAVTGIILALSVALSAIDMFFEHLSINVGGIAIDMRIFDLTMIIIGLPMAGFAGSLIVGLVEPWFHFLIDGDHHPLQVTFDSLDYMLVVIVFFLIYFLVFQNSPIHKELDGKKRWFKHIVPGIIIVILLSLLFSGTFILGLFVTKPVPPEKNAYLVLFGISLGLQLLRFTIMYGLFVLVESKLKPVIHHYH